MGNFTHATTWLTPSSTTANSENASFPVTNVNDYTHPGRLYKATGCGTTLYVTFDLGSPQTIAAIVIDNTNVDSVKIQGNAADSWSTPSYTQVVSITRDPIDGRYKVYHAPNATYRYWRILCWATQVVDDSSIAGSVWAIGGVSLFGTVTTWAVNAEFPYDVTMRQGLAGDEDMAGGGYEPTALGPRYALITLAQSRWPTSSGGTDVWAQITALAGISSASPVMFYRNYSSTAEVYICRRRGEATVALTGPGVMAARSLVFRELV